jgi:excisionase family DNA binding protein
MSDPKPDPEYLKIGEAARFLGVNPRTIYRRVWSGDLPAARIGGLYFIRKSDLEVLLSARRAEIPDEHQTDSAPLKCSLCYRLLSSDSQIGEVCAADDCDEIICVDCVSRGHHFCARHTPTLEQRITEAEQRHKSGEFPLFVKASSARLREINFLNRLRTRLQSMNSFLHPVTGELIDVPDWSSVLEQGDNRTEVMHLLGKVVIGTDTLSRMPLNTWLSGSPALPRGANGGPVRIEMRVLSRLDEMVQNGFDSRPFTDDDLIPLLTRYSDETRQEKEVRLVLLASVTGWDPSARLLIQGSTDNKGSLPFAHPSVMVYLFDLEKGDLIYNAQDDRILRYAELFVPTLPTEEIDEVKAAIEKELVLYDSLTLENAVQELTYTRSQIELAFERLASTGRFSLVQIPNLGLTLTRK